MSTPDSVTRVKVFSATMSRSRGELGGRVSNWIAAHPQTRILKTFVLQSSDRSFHCMSVVLLCHEDSLAETPAGGA